MHTNSKIEKLKQIISANEELQNHLHLIQDNWNEKQINVFIYDMLQDFEIYHEKQIRPKFYTELETLLNKYGEDNIYQKPI